MEDPKEIAMRRRLQALLRKTHLPETVGHGESLVNLLVQHIRTKREYEALLGDGDGVHDFSLRHKLTPEHSNLLLELKRVKDIFVPNRLLDNFLTFAFVLEALTVLYLMHQAGYMVVFVLVALAIISLMHCVLSASKTCGHSIASWLVHNGWVDGDPLDGKVQMKKWQEQSWYLVSHVLFTAVELLILSNEGSGWWADPGRQCWLPRPREQAALHTPLLRIFYMAQLAYYMYTTFVHRFVEERRKDYFVMYLHHVVTLCLVAVSWAHNYWRIGLLIVFIHDISDIAVDVLKLVNYLKLEGPRGWYASEVAYVSCVLSWMYWRLWQFPVRAIRGAYDGWDWVPSSSSTGGYMVPDSSIVYLVRRLFNTTTAASAPDLPLLVEGTMLCCVLLVLHIYWLHLFLMIGYRILTESAREASRQEYEGDSDDGLDQGREGGQALADRLQEFEVTPSSLASHGGVRKTLQQGGIEEREPTVRSSRVQRKGVSRVKAPTSPS